MKTIALTQSKITVVDDEDYERLLKFSWCVHRSGKRNCASTNYKSKTILMHRLILNAPENMQVDHINGNTLDNCKANLRLCTNQQNQFNQKIAQRNNRLGIKGVCKAGNRFQAYIHYNSKKRHLGTFNILGDADSAYRRAEDKLFGEFSRNYSERGT